MPDLFQSFAHTQDGISSPCAQNNNILPRCVKMVSIIRKRKTGVDSFGIMGNRTGINGFSELKQICRFFSFYELDNFYKINRIALNMCVITCNDKVLDV